MSDEDDNENPLFQFKDTGSRDDYIIAFGGEGDTDWTKIGKKPPIDSPPKKPNPADPYSREEYETVGEDETDHSNSYDATEVSGDSEAGDSELDDEDYTSYESDSGEYTPTATEDKNPSSDSSDVENTESDTNTADTSDTPDTNYDSVASDYDKGSDTAKDISDDTEIEDQVDDTAEEDPDVEEDEPEDSDDLDADYYKMSSQGLPNILQYIFLTTKREINSLRKTFMDRFFYLNQSQNRLLQGKRSGNSDGVPRISNLNLKRRHK